MPVRKILVAADSSPPSERALRMAVELADEHGIASVDLVHVATEIHDYLPLDRWIWGDEAEQHGVAEPAREAAQRVFDDYVQALPKDLRSRVNPILIFGLPPERILELAEEGGYDLLVMGTHGRTGVSRVALGSVVARVLPRAPCPVLVVH
jgi:nucleotide-binding universal stress UspA family protein